MSDNKSICDTCLYKYNCLSSDAGMSGTNRSVCNGYAPNDKLITLLEEEGDE